PLRFSCFQQFFYLHNSLLLLLGLILVTPQGFTNKEAIASI
ncbi:unnamed protein product, partial [Callosobruchus maculatus]